MLVLQFMFWRPDTEPYVDVIGSIRKRNRVEGEGVCVIGINNGELAGRLRDIRYGHAVRPQGIIGDPKIGTEVIMGPTRTIILATDKVAENLMSRLIRTFFRGI